MNGTENPSDRPADSHDLRYELESLRSLLAFALVLMIVSTLCLDAFLYHEANELNGQANEQAQSVIVFQKVGMPQAINFWNKITDYGSRHPDFAPVLAKYKPFITVRTNTAAVKK